MKSSTTLISFFLFLCCQIAYGSPIVKGVEDIYVVSTYLPSYATVLISLGALLLLAYFILGCVCCPNKSIKALSYQNGFPVSRLNENTFENPTEITIFPPHSTVIDLQPVNRSFPGFDEKVTFEPLPDILPKNFTTGQSAACSSRPAHFSALLKSKVSLHDWFDDPNSNFPREQLQYLQEIGIGWFGRVVKGEASQICDNEEKTTVIVKILREEASPSEHLHFLHEVRPYRDLKHSNVIKLLGRCLESDPFLLILEHSTSDLKTYLSKQEREQFLQDGLTLQMISNIASGLRYMHDKGFCHMDLAAHNCFVCNDNSVKIGDYGISFDRWRGDYYCLGDIALPIRWYSPEILMCSETTIETKEITREANVWAFGVVLWEIAELGKLPYENLSDEEVLQKVLIEKSTQLLPPTSELLCKDEIVLVMRECWKPRKHRPSMEKIENFIMQLYNDRLSIKKQELSFEERWNSIQPRITEISSYTGTESSSLKFENDFSVRSDLQNYSSDNEILSSFEMSFDILPKTGFNGQLSPSLNVLNGSIDELTEDDVYLNSISLSCGKYDADTLSNISDKDNFQMEEDKENSNSNNVISDQISAAIRDLDLVLASQPDSSRNSTLQKTKTVLHNPGINVNDKEPLVNGIFKESEYLSKSSDLSNISESSFSRSSNFSEHVDHVKVKSNDLSVNSDLNGNCNFCDNVNEEHSDVDCAELTCESDRHHPKNIMLCRNPDDGNKILINNASQYNTKQANIETASNFLSSMGDSSKMSSVPDIVIHESPTEILEENAEPDNTCIEQNQNSQKSFRFIFKDIEKNAADISHQEFDKELVHDLTETLKQSDQSKPLTSTPVKSSSDSVSPPPDSNMTGNNSSDDVFCDALMTPPDQKIYVNETNHESEVCKNKITPIQTQSNSAIDYDMKVKSSGSINSETAISNNFDHFTTAQSSLLSNINDLTETKLSQKMNHETYMNYTKNEVNPDFIDTSHSYNLKISSDIEPEKNSASSTLYVSTDNISKDFSPVLSDVISPPNGYLASQKDNYSNHNSDIENEYLEDSKASETVSPPQGFQDGLAILNDSCSESKASFDQDLSTSAECGSSENLDHYLEDDHISHANISAAKLLETSFPDMESKSFTYETCADFSGNMRPRKNNSNISFSGSNKQSSKLYHSDYEGHRNYNLYDNAKAPIQSYDQMIVEDLNTGEQTIINESYSVCDDYENSGESDEILKINIETDEAIIVDSSEALIGFVPSRSIELLQEFEVIPPLNPPYNLEEEKESSDSMNIDAYNSASPSPAAMKHSSPYESPEIAYPQPYRNFCLQNEVIEEEITDEIVSPSSFHSSSSYCSNEIFMDEEKMSQSSESAHQGEMYETSVLPSMDHLYVVSDDGSKTDVSSSECSPVKQNGIVNASYRTDAENNHIEDGSQEDVMHSYQPTQSVRWLSDEMLDVDSHDQSPIIIEGREILAGDIIQTCELTAEDIATALSQLETKGHLHGLTPNHLNISESPSPFSSVESSPCRDTVYTPDFESDSEETNSGTSCSSTSGSFECIHNKFKNTNDISKVADESDKSASSREHSPMKIFSKTWDCHATPTRGVLVTPEKKFNSMRKSVSFHEEDPHVVFEYPPASDSSEDGYPSDDNEVIPQSIDYLKYADWDLQVTDADDIEAEEIVEIEELDSEPYVRRPSYSRSSVGPLNRPMLYTLTAGFSDEDFDISETVPPFSLNAPSNSPDEDKGIHVSVSEFSEMIEKQLLSQINKENQETLGNSVSSQNFVKESSYAPTMSVQESVVSSVELSDIILDELLPKSQINSESVTVHRNDNVKINFDKLIDSDDDDDDEIEEVIVEELSEGESESDSFEFNKENRPVVLETDNTFTHDIEFMNQPVLSVHKEISDGYCIGENEATTISSDINDLNYPPELHESKDTSPKNPSKSNIEIQDFKNDFLKENIDTSLKSELNTHNVSSENVQNIETGFKSSHTSEAVLNEDCILLHDFALESIKESPMKNTVSDHIISDATKSIAAEKSNSPDITDLQFNLTNDPVHIESLDINSTEKSADNSVHEIGYVSKSFTEVSSDEVTLNSQSFFQSNILEEKEEIVKTVIPNSSESSVSINVNSIIEEANESTSTNSSTDCNEKPKGSKNSSDSFDLSDKMLHSVGADSAGNQTAKGSESLVSDNSALINNLHECSISVDENVAQNTTTQLINSSSNALADLSEVFFTPDSTVNITPDIQSSGNVLHSSEVKIESESPVDISAYVKKDSLCNSTHLDKIHDDTELLSVPKIIVTPASESEVEDELEEYLRGQLEHFHSEASPQEDFSVTSEYSCRPFDDVFGSYISGDSSDYIEAYNFEFENGNFFDDYIDDYPLDLQTDGSDKLYPDDGQQKRSSSLPVMTENVSDDDSLTVKSDSSLIYDTSKGITRL